MKYYLRMEAVNFDSFVLDTQDLSTIRGGSLLLLRSPEEVHARFRDRLTKIATGASSGLFSLELPDDCSDPSPEEVMETLRRDVADYLTNHDSYRHATFVVDWVRVDDEQLARQRVLAKNRWRQLRQPTVAMPESREPDQAPQALAGGTTDELRAQYGQSGLPCSIDHVRSASEPVGGESRWVSRSVLVRRTFGREQKQGFYGSETGLPIDWGFTHTLKELTARAPDGQSPRDDDDRAGLHHKMAVIYLDGNRFGRVASSLPEAGLRTFAEQVLKYRRGVLRSLLETVPEWCRQEGKGEWFWRAEGESPGKCRIETLLWGGDELMWVVPAWQGWRVLEFFYDRSANWRFEYAGRAIPLTHAAGLVFCSHKAPIHRIKMLAEELARAAKAIQSDHQTLNVFSYEVLESFDHIGRGFDEYRRERCPPDVPTERLLLHGEQMATIRKCIAELKEDDQLARRRVVRLARQMVRDPDAARQASREWLGTLPSRTRNTLEEFRNAIGHADLAHYHLAELWDYVC